MSYILNKQLNAIYDDLEIVDERSTQNETDIDALEVGVGALPTIVYNEQTTQQKASARSYITIKSQSADPISEHSPDILARLPPDKKIGKGMPKFPLESIGFVLNLPMEAYKLKGYVINQVME